MRSRTILHNCPPLVFIPQFGAQLFVSPRLRLPSTSLRFVPRERLAF